MNRREALGSTIALGVLALAESTAGSQPAADPAALERQVAAAERAFARTMADRDLAAFTRHLAEEAVFFGRERVTRGRPAVAAEWKRYFDAPAAPFSWEPDRVQVLDSGSLAFSTGPVSDPAGRRVGTFNSVWRREPDGSWRIVFDSGCPPCQCQ